MHGEKEKVEFKQLGKDDNLRSREQEARGSESIRQLRKLNLRLFALVDF